MKYWMQWTPVKATAPNIGRITLLQPRLFPVLVVDEAYLSGEGLVGVITLLTRFPII